MFGRVVFSLVSTEASHYLLLAITVFTPLRIPVLLQIPLQIFFKYIILIYHK